MNNTRTKYEIKTFDSGVCQYFMVYAHVKGLKIAVLMTLDYDEAMRFINIENIIDSGLKVSGD